MFLSSRFPVFLLPCSLRSVPCACHPWLLTPFALDLNEIRTVINLLPHEYVFIMKIFWNCMHIKWALWINFFNLKDVNWHHSAESSNHLVSDSHNIIIYNYIYYYVFVRYFLLWHTSILPALPPLLYDMCCVCIATTTCYDAVCVEVWHYHSLTSPTYPSAHWYLALHMSRKLCLCVHACACVHVCVCVTSWITNPIREYLLEYRCLLSYLNEMIKFM